jgi:hypothetical protein
MTLTNQIEQKVRHPFFFLSARKTNQFIESIISEATANCNKAWEAEKLIMQRITDWNNNENHFKLTCGSGAAHVYIHLEKQDFKQPRLAIIREVLLPS